jgi:hypothetical protein
VRLRLEVDPPRRLLDAGLHLLAQLGTLPVDRRQLPVGLDVLTRFDHLVDRGPVDVGRRGAGELGVEGVPLPRGVLVDRDLLLHGDLLDCPRLSCRRPSRGGRRGRRRRYGAGLGGHELEVRRTERRG